MCTIIIGNVCAGVCVRVLFDACGEFGKLSWRANTKKNGSFFWCESAVWMDRTLDFMTGKI